MTRYTINEELYAYRVTYGDAVAYRSTEREAWEWIEQMDRVERAENWRVLIAYAATVLFLVVVSAAIL